MVTQPMQVQLQGMNVTLHFKSPDAFWEVVTDAGCQIDTFPKNQFTRAMSFAADQRKGGLACDVRRIVP